MNKKIAEYLSKYDLQIEKNYAYGNIKNYEVNIFYNAIDNVAPLKIYISFFATEEEKNKMFEQLQKEKIKFLQYQFDIFGLLIGLNDITVNSLLKKIDGILDKIFNIISENNGKNNSYCSLCGEEFSEDSKIYKVNDCKFKLHYHCGGEIKEAFEEEYQEYQELPNNYTKGFFGALLGTFIGVISYIVIFLLGFISSISSFISILLGSLFYKKFGGKPNYVMVIMTSVLTVSSLLLTVYFLYCVAALGMVYESDPQSQATLTEAFKIMMANSEFSKEFSSNMVMTIIFTLLGAGYEAFSLYKGVYKKQQIK